MERVRRNRAAGVSGLAVLAVIVLVWGVFGGAGGSSGALGPTPLATPTATPRQALTGVPTPAPATPTDAPALAPPGGPASVGTSAYQGLRGHSRSESIPQHHLVLSLRSSHKLPFVIYNIPTSRDHPGGQSVDLGTTWSLSTTVYGKPDYAQLFTRAGPQGYPITCTITVDGRVTAQLTSGGPYGKIFCQG